MTINEGIVGSCQQITLVRNLTTPFENTKDCKPMSPSQFMAQPFFSSYY